MRKNIALILALVMILSLVPLTAFAASDNSVDRVPTVSEDFEFNTERVVPVLRIEERNPGEFGTAPFFFRLNLTNAEFLNVTNSTTRNFSFTAGEQPGINEAVRRTATSYTIEAELDTLIPNTTRVLEIPLVTEVGSEGEARVTIDPLGSAVSGGTWTFAIVAEGDTIATVTSANRVVGRGEEQQAGVIIIDEASVSALSEGYHEVRIRLPRNIEWNTRTLLGDQGTGGITFPGLQLDTIATAANWFEAITTDTANDEYLYRIANDGRDLFVGFNIDVTSGTRGSIIIPTYLDVARAANFGDITVDIRGMAGDISDASGLKIGEYVDFAAAVEVDEVIEMYAGRYDDEYEITIVIDPQLEFSLAQGRFIEFELPSWAAFVDEDTTGTTRINDQTREVRVDSDMAQETDDIEFDFTIVAEGTAVPMGELMRELEMTISGAGIPETTLVVADVLAPVSVVVAEQTVPFQIGMQRQVAPEITITENYPGAIMEGNLDVFVRDQFANSMRFDAVSYELLEGDMEIDDVERATRGDFDESVIRIIVDEPSDNEAAVIRLFNIEMTLDRTVPMGVFRLDVGGTALIDYFVETDVDNPWDFATRVARFDYITVGTPIDPTVPVPAQVAFTVGQMAYWVDGEMRMMDVAPFISEGRIMVPVRYMEELFSMQPIWNPTARTVTVMYNNQVFEMTIGSNMLRVNGAPFMEMDAEATIVDSRTFVPLSRFARAMNIPYVWDAATQTVTFN